MRTITKKEYLSPRIEEQEFRVESGIALSQEFYDSSINPFIDRDIVDFWN